MIKRSTWIIIAILVLAVGAYYLLQNRPSKATQATPTFTGNSYLVTQSDGVLQSIRIIDKNGNAFQMQKDLSKTWVITIPTSGVADQSSAAEAETQVSALRIVAVLETPPASKAAGLANPAYTLELGFASRTSHKIEVGDLTQTSSGYYVRYDDGKIYIISQPGIDALLNLLKAPPFPATATPDPTSDSTRTSTSVTASPTP